jgi:hypothetical protein
LERPECPTFMSYRITAPYSRPIRVEPSHLQEIDVSRVGSVTTYESGARTQNARLRTPVTIVAGPAQETIVYPVNAYIRLYTYEGGQTTVHLISRHPLP